ncbi:MAG: hypothetical protein N2491_01485 [Negativicutes bacterium]|nr:hypothetical protein [Negativicutes bacterium]
MKKIVALTLVLLLAFSSVSFAAVSSSKSSSPRPSSGTTVKPSTPQAAPGTTGSGYKPSAPASSYSEKAPATQVKPGTGQVPPSQQPSTGGFWRNAGLFGSGMLLGGLLGNMFGFGHMGFMASLLGVLINILFLAAIIAAIRWVWLKFKNRDNGRNRRGSY